eukprot:IDg2104t1
MLNKLSVRRDFYTATMQPGEKMLVYINYVRQMAATLQSMEVEIYDKEMAIAVLDGFPPRFCTIVTALDAIEPYCWEKHGRPESKSRTGAGHTLRGK